MKAQKTNSKRLSAIGLVVAVGLTFWTIPSRADIAQVNSIATNGAGTVVAINLPYSVSSGANVLVLMIAGYGGSYPGSSGIGYNGKPFTLAVCAVSKVTTIRQTSIWYLNNPDIGSFSITGNCNIANSHVFGAFTLSGVNTNVAPSVSTGEGNPSLKTSVTVTNAEGAWVVAVEACSDTNNGSFSWTNSLGVSATSLFQGTGKDTTWGAGVFKGLNGGTNTITGTYSGSSVGGKSPMAVACFAPSTNAIAAGTTPTIANAGVDNIGFTNADLRGMLSSTGSSATAASVFWGKTDQWPSTNGWEGGHFFGDTMSTGSLVWTASNLTGNTLYYYRHFATNSAGVSWASQGSFTTLADSPAFSGTGATPASSNATLYGTVTGAPSITVYGFWGLTNGFTNVTSWANSTNLGIIVPGASFSAIATGLTVNTAYYYRFMGSNSAGIGWSASNATFLTINPNLITWISTAGSGSWGTPGNWDHAPLFDGTEDAVVGSMSVGQVLSTLDGIRTINSLTTAGNYKFNIEVGSSPSAKLIIRSGNFTRNNANYNQFTAPIQVDDGTNANPNATWYIGGASQLDVYRIIGLAGTTITKTGVTASLTFFIDADNTTNYFGKWVLVNGVTVLSANNAFGTNSVTVANNAQIRANGTILASNDVVVGAGGAYLSASTSNRFTQAGNLRGSGPITLGDTLNEGAVRVAGPANTHSGGVVFYRGCPLVVSGVWTNSGSIDLWSSVTASGSADPSLQGNGSIGLAFGAKVLSSRPDLINNDRVYIAPGDGTPLYPRADHNPLLLGAGTIGTLTVGTPGNSNAVEFPQNTWLLADVNTSAGDTLAVNGLLNLNFASNALAINGTVSRLRPYTLAQYESCTGKFANVYWNSNLVSGATAKNAINGTHTLVYGATSLQLVPEADKGTVVIVR